MCEGKEVPSLDDTDRLRPLAAQYLVGRTDLTLVSRSLSDTALIANGLANVLLPGDVVLLIGDLGAGKTAFTKALARSLHIDEPITSPTFTIMRTYEGVLPLGAEESVTLAHLDAYRLEHADAIEDLGLFELLDHGAVAVIEWGDFVAEAFDMTPLVVRFSTGFVLDGVLDLSASELADDCGDGDRVDNGDNGDNGDEFADNQPRLIECSAHPEGPWQTRLVVLQAAVQPLVLPRSSHAPRTS